MAVLVERRTPDGKETGPVCKDCMSLIPYENDLDLSDGNLSLRILI